MSGRLARDAAVDRRRYTWRWGRVLAAIAAGGIGFFVLQGADLPIAQWCDRVVRIEDASLLDQVVEGFKNFSQVLTSLAIITFVALVDPRRKRIIIALLVAQIGAKGTYEVIKHITGRDRPYVAVARAKVDNSSLVDSWRGARIGNTSRDYQSFPSGHSAAAFALAGVLAWYYPRAAALFWVLAVGCMAQRVIALQHWPTDCVVGGALGYLWAQIGLRIGR